MVMPTAIDDQLINVTVKKRMTRRFMDSWSCQSTSFRASYCNIVSKRLLPAVQHTFAVIDG